MSINLKSVKAQRSREKTVHTSREGNQDAGGYFPRARKGISKLPPANWIYSWKPGIRTSFYCDRTWWSYQFNSSHSYSSTYFGMLIDFKIGFSSLFFADRIFLGTQSIYRWGNQSCWEAMGAKNRQPRSRHASDSNDKSSGSSSQCSTNQEIRKSEQKRLSAKV